LRIEFNGQTAFNRHQFFTCRQSFPIRSDASA
jgi:hypothetical protein